MSKRGQASADASDISTRQRIVDASMTLFTRRGYHGTGIRDIAIEAKLSTATLYHYMGTKEDLLMHIMREANLRLTVAAARSIESTEDPAERISYLARVLVITEATHRLTIISDTELRVLSPDGAKEIRALRDAYETLWAAAISDGVNAGEFHPEDEQVSRFALLQMCTGVAHWFYPGGRLTLPTIASHYGDLALALLDASRDGQRLTSSSLGLHDADVEIGLVAQEFESFCSPRARPTHFAMIPR